MPAFSRRVAATSAALLTAWVGAAAAGAGGALGPFGPAVALFGGMGLFLGLVIMSSQHHT